MSKVLAVGVMVALSVALFAISENALTRTGGEGVTAWLKYAGGTVILHHQEDLPQWARTCQRDESLDEGELHLGSASRAKKRPPSSG
ncbi:MAG: hypothetical protein OXL33_03530 [Chloroflexota bacterium]|nr:hypothetical protein [Chloroflexota bacterium]